MIFYFLINRGRKYEKEITLVELLMVIATPIELNVIESSIINLRKIYLMPDYIKKYQFKTDIFLYTYTIFRYYSNISANYITT